ncbi:ribose-phosphate pyrophosphokinase [Niallia taxi]|uniref:Ribose-phosphate pyrophosphokinase n=1 Tax=Niallia taxi TaxID=2499688 RepID=A0A437KGH0_9BACI|nr:ribose-phosphate pyrophosphokinase [Niallia taxi]MCM3218098.1 ribose-phosphate pyrophosphokinase [Niallia taxi]MDK8638975.1 ribose-phosphate pyrophosphokinase [Niallia taxi]MED4036779.1 ribose-phosphate pyrophosphokinase [Niallia taxi]RVT67396.1 ribose-phosphate pyrophosphokinase [Niallia taxi]
MLQEETVVPNTYKGSKLKVFSLNANPELAQEIVENLGTELGKCSVKKFSDGEIQINIEESVRGCDVFVIQPTSEPVNQSIMELLIMIDALKRASVKCINVVIPYYAYARQDRKAQPREPITAKLIANLIQKAGADRVITMDLHAPQTQGFFNIPVDQLLAMPILAQYLLTKDFANDVVVVAPDHGSTTRARELADRLKAPIAIIDKRGSREIGEKREVNIVGNIEGKTAIIIDDIIDTAYRVTTATKALLDNGAKEVYACCTHPVLSEMAIENISESHIKELIVTNSIPLTEEKKISKITQLTIAPLLSDAISRVYEQKPVSVLFK